MRKKNITALLALFFGIVGIHRFYLGQYERGVLHIVAPVALILLILWIAELFGTSLWDTVRENLAVELSGQTLLLLLPLLIIPVFDTIWFFTRSLDRFNARYNKKKVSWAGEILTSAGYIMLAGVVAWWLYDRFLVEHKAEVNVEADFNMTTEELAMDFHADETVALSKYTNKIIIVSGEITGEEFGSGSGERMLILRGTESYSVKCEFQTDQLAMVVALQMGQAISVKGRFSDRTNQEIHLQDCLLIEPAANTPRMSVPQ